jgi:hypothetical protein
VTNTTDEGSQDAKSAAKPKASAASAQPKNEGQPKGESSDNRSDAQKEWEERQNRLRTEQGLPEGAVPEDRELRYRDPPESQVVRALRKAGDTRGGQTPAHGFEEYQRADSDAQKKKAAEESAGNTRFFAGQRGWVNNPGAPDHGRAVHVLNVAEYESEMDEVLDRLQGGRGKAKAYFTESRDGRAEKLTISAEHFMPAANEAEWGKTPLMTARPDIGLDES